MLACIVGRRLLGNQSGRLLLHCGLLLGRHRLYRLLGLSVCCLLSDGLLRLRVHDRLAGDDLRARQRLLRCGLGFGFSCLLGQALGFALTATNLARIVRCAAARRQRRGGSQCRFGLLDNRLRGGLGRCFRLGDLRYLLRRFLGRLYRNIGRRLGWCRFFAGFALVDAFARSRLGDWRVFDDRSDAFAAGLDHRVFGQRRLGRGFGVGGVGGQGGGSSGDGDFPGLHRGIALVGVFDFVAVGIALAFATVAATTLTTGATTWSLAVVAFRAFVGFLSIFGLADFQGLLQQFIRRRCLLFGARLALFARGAWLAGLALGLLLLRYCRCFVDRSAQFTLALFAWLALFSRSTLATWLGFSGLCLLAGLALLARRAWLALFTRLTFFASLALLAGLPFFARLTLFTRLALLVTPIAGIAAAILLTAAAALVVALRTGGCRLLLYLRRGLGLFGLAREQTNQRFDQALEQAWFLRGRSHGRFRRCRSGAGGGCATLRCGLDRGLLANQGASRTDRLDFFGLALAHFVAGLAGDDLRAVVTQALNFEVRRFQVVVRQDEDARAGAQFDLGDGVALFIEQERRDLEGHAGADFGGAILEGLFFDQAQDRQ